MNVRGGVKWLAILGVSVLLVVAFFLLFPVYTVDHRPSKSLLTLGNIRHVAFALAIYQEDSGGRFPPDMSSMSATRPFLGPYTKNDDVTLSLNPGSPNFLGNATLSGTRGTDILEPEKTLEFFDSAPWENGTRCVSFTDSHVKKLPESQFQRAIINHWVDLGAGP